MKNKFFITFISLCLITIKVYGQEYDFKSEFITQRITVTDTLMAKKLVQSKRNNLKLKIEKLEKEIPMIQDLIKLEGKKVKDSNLVNLLNKVYEHYEFQIATEIEGNSERTKIETDSRKGKVNKNFIKYLSLYENSLISEIDNSKTNLLKKDSELLEKMPTKTIFVEKPNPYYFPYESQGILNICLSGEGETAEKAIQNALLYGLENMYNTLKTISKVQLNKSQIVSESSTYVMDYQLITEQPMVNNNRFVLINASIHIPITHKEEGTFKSSSFALKTKIKELQNENEIRNMQYLLDNVKYLYPLCYNMELNISEPITASIANLTKCISYNRITSYIIGAYSTHFDSKTKQNITNTQKKNIITNWFNSAENSYLLKATISFKGNEQSGAFKKFIFNCLHSISLQESEKLKYKEEGESYTQLKFGWEDRYETFYFRMSYQDTNDWIYELQNYFANATSNFWIVDNLGVKSSFNGYTLAQIVNRPQKYTNNFIRPEFVNKIRNIHFNPDHSYPWPINYILEGTGIFAPLIVACYDGCLWEEENMSKTLGRDDQDFIRFRYSYKAGNGFELGPRDHLKWTIHFLIPKNKIGQYTDFKLAN